MSKVKETRLPYLNNTPIILITMAINLFILLVSGWGRSFDLTFILVDGAICGVVTAVLDVILIHRHVDTTVLVKTLVIPLVMFRYMQPKAD